MYLLPLRFLILFASIFFLFAACKKTEKTVYEDYILSENPVPAYKGVSGLQIKNYINKLKVDLLGEQPTEAEFSAWMHLLIKNELSDSSRTVLVEKLFAEAEYYDRLFEWNSANMLESLDYNALDDQIATVDYVIDLQYTNGDTVEAQLLEKELSKLNLLRSVSADYSAGNIDIAEFYIRLINNSFYDEINMGTENFVIATFENILGRLPTSYELENAKNITEGELGNLFLESGNNKDDFMQIFMHSDAFRQGVIQLQYDFLLARELKATELEVLLPILENQSDIRPIQNFILISDEYAGFE